MLDSRRTGRTIEQVLEDHDAVTAALGRGVENALRRHKRLGNPICCWKDGKGVTIPPEEIEVDEPRG